MKKKVSQNQFSKSKFQPEKFEEKNDNKQIVAELPLAPAPKHGEKAKSVVLVTNFFRVELPTSIPVYVYHVSYDEPEIPDDKLSRTKAWSFFEQLEKQVELGSRPLFDGKHTLFLLKNIGDLKSVTLILKKQKLKADQIEKKDKRQKITLKKTNQIRLFGFDLTPETTRVLEVFVRTLFPKYDKKGRGIFDPNKSSDDIDIKESDLKIKKGISFTFHLCAQGLLLHSDIIHNISMGTYSLDHWILLRARSSEIRLQNGHSDISEIFTNPRLKSFKYLLASDLKDKSFYLNHLPSKIKRRIFNVDFKMTARNCFFDWVNPETQQTSKMSVEEYYLKKYKRRLSHPESWPLVVVKRSGKLEYYPLEVCQIEEGQTRMGITALEKKEIISSTKVDLVRRFQELSEKVTELSKNISLQKDIPLTVHTEPLRAEGRVLPCPAVIYKNKVIVESERGEWKQPKDVQFFQTVPFTELHFAYPSLMNVNSLNNFASKLVGNLEIKTNSKIHWKSYTYDQTASITAQAQMLYDSVKRSKEFPFVIVIIPGKKRNPERYNTFKSKLELELGIGTQFVMEEVAVQCKPAPLENIVCSMNRKGRPQPSSNSFPENWRVCNLPLVDKPTGFIGIDVHHPPMGTVRPSEAAISISCNPGVTTYYSTFRSQDRGLEEVKDLYDMLVESLGKVTVPFQNIIIIRDGIATTQFQTTALKELEDLKNAIKHNPRWSKIPQPKVAYIVAQKRNLCKLAATDVNGSFYIPAPGTVLDAKITGTECKDFYLVSQRAPQGVARPVRYFVYYDELNLDISVWEDLMYKLCYLHPGCNRAVSVPMPLYNAHKLGYRVGQVYRASFEHTEVYNPSEQSNEESSLKNSGHKREFPTVNIPLSLKWTHFYL